MKTRHIHISIICVLLSAILAACAPAAKASINVENAYGHPSAKVPGAGGLFMLIKNSGTAPDKLVSGKSDACGMVEIHEMVQKSDGTMGMNLVPDPVEIPAGGQLELKDGGMHIMCMMAKDQFKAGNQIILTLVFEKSGEKTVSVDIQRSIIHLDHARQLGLQSELGVLHLQHGDRRMANDAHPISRSNSVRQQRRLAVERHAREKADHLRLAAGSNLSQRLGWY